MYLYIGGGGAEQVFELHIIYISRGHDPEASRTSAFPLVPLEARLSRGIVYVIFISHTLPSDFIFGYRARARSSLECISSRCYARLHAGKSTPYLPAICANHDRDNLTPETEYTRARDVAIIVLACI